MEELRSKLNGILQQFRDVDPKKIVKRMNEPGLPNVNLSSYLQKHRLSLKKENEATAAVLAQQDGMYSGSESSGVKRIVGINEPIQINTEDIAGQIDLYSKTNGAPLLNMRTKPYVLMMQQMTSPRFWV